MHRKKASTLKKEINPYSVRAKMLHLMVGKESVRFKDFQQNINANDYQINLELKKLKKWGWITKTGKHKDTRYSLNPDNHGVSDAMFQLTPFEEITQTNDFSGQLEYIRDSLNDSIELLDKKDDLIDKKIELIKTALAFSHISVSVDGKKIPDLQNQVQIPHNIALFLRDIAYAKATSEMIELLSKDENKGKHPYKIHEDVLNQESFKVVISWNPATEPSKYHELLDLLVKQERGGE